MTYKKRDISKEHIDELRILYNILRREYVCHLRFHGGITFKFADFTYKAKTNEEVIKLIETIKQQYLYD